MSNGLRILYSALFIMAAFFWHVESAIAQNSPVVVELFTAQGCPACPPAEALLDELSTREGILVMEFHVDYWDGSGWKDKFSRSASTDRQRDYIRAKGQSELATPLFVINGTTQIPGSDREIILRAVQKARGPSIADVKFATDGKSVSVAGATPSGTVFLARLRLRTSTVIASGENAHRKIVDVNAVKSFDSLGSWDRSPATLTFEGPNDGEILAVLIQGSDLAILGSAWMAK